MRLWRRKEQGARSKKPRSRRWKLAVLVLVLVILASGGTAAYLVFLEDENGTQDVPFENVQEEGPPSIYYVEGNILKEATPDDPEVSILHEGISLTARTSPDGRFLVWVAFAGAKNPITHLYDIEADELMTVPGADPTWSPDGASLALLRPFGKKTTCTEDECRGTTQIAVYSPEAGEARDVTPYVAQWTLHGWLDGRIVGEFGPQEEVTLLVDAAAETQAIWVDYPAKNITSISPDGNWVTGRTERGPELLEVVEAGSPVLNVDPSASPEDNASPDEEASPEDAESPDDSESPEDEASPGDSESPGDEEGSSQGGQKRRKGGNGKTGQVLPLADKSYAFEFAEALGDRTVNLRDISWREDSAGLAVAYSEQAESILKLIDPETGEQTTFRDGIEPVDDIFWSPEGGGLVFTLVNRADVLLEATYCPLDGNDDCTTYVDWQSGKAVAGTVPD